MSVPTWAVIPSAGRDYLKGCIASVRDQVDGIVVVTNSEYDGADIGSGMWLVHDLSDDRNISRWWNVGLGFVAARCEGPHNVLVLNDDVEMRPGSVARLSSALRESGATIAFPGVHDALLTEPGPDRITGWCWMAAGESGIRADERFVWWAGDNDLDHVARSMNGARVVTGVDHVHHDPNGYTNRVASLTRQAGIDVETFRAKWGRLPY